MKLIMNQAVCGARIGGLKSLGIAAAIATAALTGSGCTRHRVEIAPIRVEPITLNINLRIERELEEAFDFEDRVKAELEEQASSASTQPQPASSPSVSSTPANGGSQ